MLKPIIPFESLLCPKYQSRLIESINRRSPEKVKISVDEFKQILAPLELFAKHSLYVDELDEAYGVKHEEFTSKRASMSAAELESAGNELRSMREAIKLIRKEIYELEDTIFPVLKSLPNILDPVYEKGSCKNLRKDGGQYNNFEKIISVSRRKSNEKKSFKQLDFVKLCYINSAFYSSIISPDGVYLLGQMAQLHDALLDKAEKMLRDNGYIDYTGLDFVKSGVIEASFDETVIFSLS